MEHVTEGSWESLPMRLHPRVLGALRELGFPYMTPVQVLGAAGRERVLRAPDGGGQAGQGGSERAGSPWEFCGVFRLPALRLPALVNDPGRLGAAAHLRPGPEQRDPSVYECWGRGARCIPALPL